MSSRYQLAQDLHSPEGMKWIEQIRVRSSEAALAEAMPSLLQQVTKIDESVADAETFVMRHGLYDGDLAVVVVWTGDIEPRKTREGLMVAQLLAESGSVDHAVWVPFGGDEGATEQSNT